VLHGGVLAFCGEAEGERNAPGFLEARADEDAVSVKMTGILDS
jgi:hypothetical protein